MKSPWNHHEMSDEITMKSPWNGTIGTSQIRVEATAALDSFYSGAKAKVHGPAGIQSDENRWFTRGAPHFRKPIYIYVSEYLMISHDNQHFLCLTN